MCRALVTIGKQRPREEETVRIDSSTTEYRYLYSIDSAHVLYRMRCGSVRRRWSIICAAHRMMHVACRLFHVACCMSSVACRLLHVACCMRCAVAVQVLVVARLLMPCASLIAANPGIVHELWEVIKPLR